MTSPAVIPVTDRYGKRHEFPFDANTKLSDLKAAVENRLGVPSQYLRLFELPLSEDGTSVADFVWDIGSDAGQDFLEYALTIADVEESRGTGASGMRKCAMRGMTTDRERFLIVGKEKGFKVRTMISFSLHINKK